MSFSWILTRAHMHTVTIHTCCRRYAKQAEDRLEKKKRGMFVVLHDSWFSAICMHPLCIFALHPSYFFSRIKKPPCLSLSMLCYSLHVFSVSLGHCSACLPQSIGYGWLANHSYTTLKWQSVFVIWGMFTGCHIVYMRCMLQLPTLRTIYSCSG